MLRFWLRMRLSYVDTLLEVGFYNALFIGQYFLFTSLSRLLPLGLDSSFQFNLNPSALHQGVNNTIGSRFHSAGDKQIYCPQNKCYCYILFYLCMVPRSCFMSNNRINPIFRSRLFQEERNIIEGR